MDVTEGNTEGTPARARTSARGQSFPVDPFGLHDFRARGFPRLPSFPAPELNGKEGVGGSSRPEGFEKTPQTPAFLFEIDFARWRTCGGYGALNKAFRAGTPS